MPLSTSTTVVANVRERATGAVSAILTTSPPILLGRKLLKKLATRNDDVSQRKRKSRGCAFRSMPHRHVLATIMPRYKPDATNKDGGEACRAACHNRPTSTRANSTHRSATLTAAFATDISRPRFGLAAEGDSECNVINKRRAARDRL